MAIKLAYINCTLFLNDVFLGDVITAKVGEKALLPNSAIHTIPKLETKKHVH